MAIRFVAVEPGAAKPGEAEPEALPAETDRPPDAAAGSDGVEPVAAAGEDEPPRSAPPRPGRKTRLSDGPAAAAASEGDPAAEDPAPTEAPGEVEGSVTPEAAPLLFPDLPAHPRPAARGRKNRHGFG